MENKSKVYELRDMDEPIREIMGKVPAWIVRWGNTFILILFISLLAISIVIKYPESIYSSATLTSINAPKEVKAKIDGKLIRLNAIEGEAVTQGQLLGFMESRANPYEVMSLSKIIDTLQLLVNSNKTEAVPKYLSESFQNLGEIQQSYQTFMQSFILFKQYLSSGYYVQKKKMMEVDLQYLERLDSNLTQEKAMQQEDVNMAKETFDANKSLQEDKVISPLDYRNEKSKYISKAITIPQITYDIVSNESSQHEKQKEILQLENDISQQKSIFNESLNTLKAQLDEWESKYLLIAPVSGKVAFENFLQENQQLKTGQTICFVNPENSSYYAEMVIPQGNFGKIAVGQKVFLRFPSYPFQEFGAVIGRIDFISQIPTDSGYLAKVSLQDGLNTSYKKQIQYRDGLLAQGEIITKDLRLIQRFYYSIVKRAKE
jgi:multidrug efflux pump subunit AcrA (membrane-fusion protein)